jgi:hypothetical protein
MIELLDTSPDVQVPAAEYARLLGFPRDHVLEGRSRELANSARDWYAEHGRPWIYVREAESLQLTGDLIVMERAVFSSGRLQKQLIDSDAHLAILFAVSAGPEAEAEAQKLWRDEKPDEYFFLEVFATAVVEQLVVSVGAHLCDLLERKGMSVLPHYSPGYQHWDISQQPKLLNLLKRRQQLELETLESGMLRPKKSLLGVFGVARQTQRTRRLTDLMPCQNCSLVRCQYRRVPWARESQLMEINR